MKKTDSKKLPTKLYLYRVDMKYIRALHKKDDKVPSVSPQIGKNNRVFLGIVILLNGKNYCIPLSHPKDKHDNMKGRIDFTKIKDSDGKMIGALNFNLMIPVKEQMLTIVNLQGSVNDSVAEKKYKKLCRKELLWCRKHKDDIVNKANVLYNMYNSDESFSARKRCVDFPKLEKVCERTEIHQ